MVDQDLNARLLVSKADPEALAQCKCSLEAMGFKVDSSSKRAINFHGSPQLFEQVFHSSLELTNNPQFLKEPTLPDSIADTTRGVYFPEKPELF